MSNRFSNLSGPKRHLITYRLFNLTIVLALVIFALRG